MHTFDLIVIGGGRASALAIEAAKAGQKVALIERDKLGGTCPNRGCVPSKLLIGYADVAHRIEQASRHHITAKISDIDRQQIFNDVNARIEAVDPRYEYRLPEALSLFRGQAFFASNKVIEVNGEQLTAENIVIATGARSRPPTLPEGTSEDLPVWTSDDLFPFKQTLPKSIAIVGGGFIACELGNFFHSIGIETTMLVRGLQLLPQEDQSIAEIFSKEFSKHVPTSFNTTIQKLSYDNSFSLTLSKFDEETQIEVDALLYATGRIPNSETLQLDNTDIKVNSRGFVERNRSTMETAVSGVYAAGDIAGDFQLQHAASFENAFLIEKLVKGSDRSHTIPLMPHAVFTEPEVASVGVTEQQLEAEGAKQDYIIVQCD